MNETSEVESENIHHRSLSQKDLMLEIEEIIEELEVKYDNGVPKEKIISEVENRDFGASKTKIKQALTRLHEREHRIFEPSSGKYKTI